MKHESETALDAPVKAWLEDIGYEVKSEVGSVDVVAVRRRGGDAGPGDDPVLVELKAGFSLKLLQQGVTRQSLSDLVYLAVPR